MWRNLIFDPTSHPTFFANKPCRREVKNSRYWHKCFLQSCSCWVLGHSIRDSLWTKCKGSRMWRAGDISCVRVQRHLMQTLQHYTVASNTCRDFRAGHGHWSVRRFWWSASLHWLDLYTEAIAVTREQQT